tara:strand:- start:324 stop:1649 length:1326 start_codon:yes stop_codon:yes gene_type:complete
MAFFGIDSEVADYIENQKKILEQVAKSKLKNLVNIRSQHLNKVKDNFNLSFDLRGDFNEDSFQANLFFKHKEDESDTFSVPLDKEMIGGFYSGLVERSQFGSQNEAYGVQITYEVEPYFSDSSRIALLMDFGKEELVDEIISNIYNEGSIQDTLTVGLTITPDAVLDAEFVIEPKQNPLNSIKGLKGKIELFVGGVENKDDYKLEIESNRIEYRNARIIKANSGAEIILGSLKKDGRVKVIGTRLRDGNKNEKIIKLQTFKPNWRYPDRLINEVYFNSPFTFNGTLENFESFDDLKRYSLKVTGLINKTVKNPIIDFDDELQDAGSITIQLLIDGNMISGMRHDIQVKKPPPADIKYLDRDGRSMTLEINAYGRNNKINKLHIQSGASKVGSPEIKNHTQGQTYTQKIKLKESNGPNGVKLKTTVFSNYDPKSQKFEEKFY